MKSKTKIYPIIERLPNGMILIIARDYYGNLIKLRYIDYPEAEALKHFKEHLKIIENFK